MFRKSSLPLIAASAVYAAMGATEYFVGKEGDDSNSGLSAESAFLTIKKGLGAIEAGDTLTIGPGEYEEGNTVRLATSPDSRTTIRAAIPGTVLIRGDRPASAFTRVPGRRFVWRTRWDMPVETVNERDTLTMYEEAAGIEEMDNRRAVWLMDKENSQLYIVTSDAGEPDAHDLTVSVDRGFGLCLRGSANHNLLIEGLSFTGFNCNEAAEAPTTARWGIFILYPRNVVIRDCTAFLNGGGIGLQWSKDSLVEDCVAYANGSQFSGSGGNIVCFRTSSGTIFRRCVAFGSPRAGIRFYVGAIENCLIEDCVAWDNKYDDVWIKGNPSNSWTRNTVSLSGLHSDLSENNVYRTNGYNKEDSSSLILPGNSLPLADNLADPDRMDYRPMGDSAIVGGLKDRGDVFFASPAGDDSNSGDSIRSPWRGLGNAKPGSTVYLLPGEYAGGLSVDAPGVTVRSRSGGPAVIKGGEYGLRINAEKVTLEGLSFVSQTRAGALVDADAARITSCGFADAPAGIAAEGRTDLRLDHNAFADSLGASFTLSGCAGVLRDNLISAPETADGGSLVDWNNHRSGKAAAATEATTQAPLFASPAEGDFSLRNPGIFAGRGSDGLTIGPYRLMRVAPQPRVIGPYVASVTATTANLEWWTSSDNVTSELAWGEDSSCERKAGASTSGGCYHTVSLTGLAPGARYFFRVDSRTPPYMAFANSELEKTDKLTPRARVRGEIVEFRTREADGPAREFFVSTEGDDSGDGSAHRPWRTIGRGVSEIVAGDTLTIRGGVYKEQLFIRGSGDEGRPITIRGAPGEKVWLDGNNRKLKTAVYVNSKNHILFHNLYVREVGSTQEAAFSMRNSDDITLDRIFYDGRSDGYTPRLIGASHCARLSLRNSFITRAFHGLYFAHCPYLRIENNVIYVNQVTQISIYNERDEPALLSRNIILDLILQKLPNGLVNLRDLACLTDDGNCFYTRVPDGERHLYAYSYRDGEYMGGYAAGKLYLKDLLELPRRGAPSFIANPGFPVLDELVSFDDRADWEKRWRTLGDEQRKREFGKTEDGYRPWDFEDFIPTNPLCRPGADGKPVGFDFSVP